MFCYVMIEQSCFTLTQYDIAVLFIYGAGIRTFTIIRDMVVLLHVWEWEDVRYFLGIIVHWV